MSAAQTVTREATGPRRLVNGLLRRYTGYELRSIRPAPARRVESAPRPADLGALDRAADPDRSVDRLVERPAFVLSCVRSGSTLLRLMLDSHRDICAPHELHLRRFRTSVDGTGRTAMAESGLDDDEVQFLLWDRLLHHELARSGKSVYVNKTPNDALIWAQIMTCWPDARLIFLRRHPGAIVASWARRRPRWTRDQVVRDVLAYATGMQQALDRVGGAVVRYEDLTTHPERETRRLTDFLGLDWDPAMLDYGAATHTGVRRGLGDWSDTVRAGVVRAAPDPQRLEVPDLLRPVAHAWGYL